jgi:hypothetical protein
MEIIEVKSKKQIKAFHQFTRDLYKDDNEFISHIDAEIEAIFNPKKNTEFKNGNAKRWLVFNQGKVQGKIAAFYNIKSKQSGVGFFDCINDQNVANTLFETACDWLKTNNQTQVEAPINFGERDKYWGLMVEGFKRPSYQENYNFPYYQQLFENFGFEKEIEQTTSEAFPDSERIKKFQRAAERADEIPGLKVEHFTFKQMDRFIEAFTSIYNQAWKQHSHYVELSRSRVAKLFKEMKPILREDILWFTFKDGEPIAFYLSIIDVNQIFKNLNGKLNLWGKLKFLWYRSRVKIDRIRGIIFGVIPEYQNKGLYSLMVLKMYEVVVNDPYIKSTELAWIGDFNPRMHALFRSINAQKTKLHYTYKKDL